MEKNKSQVSFYDLIILLSSDEEIRKEILPKLGPTFESTFTEYEEVDYPSIFRIVRDSNLVLENVELVLEILVNIESQVSKEGHKKVLKKMRRHFLLSFEQKVSYDKLDEKFRSDLEKSEESLQLVQSELVNVQNSLDDAKDIVLTVESESAKIYAQFVTILGIFTAIVLSVVGGLQLISSAFINLQDIPMWKTILIVSMVAIAVLSMLFLLTRWISTIVNKLYGYESERTLMDVVTNNGAFAVGIFIFCYLIIASVIFSSNDAVSKLKQIVNVWDSLPILLLLLLPIFGGIAVFIKTIDLSKYNK